MNETMRTLLNWWQTTFGNNTGDLRWWQMVLRGLLIYVLLLVLVRVGNKRFMGKESAFDLVLAIMLGSVASRGITGNAPFVPVLATMVGLVAMHWSFAALTFHTHRLGEWIKGRSRLLIQAGQFQHTGLRHSHITENDLREALRVQLHDDDLQAVREARLERNGQISFVRRRKPQVLDIQVAEGVQTIRLHLE